MAPLRQSDVPRLRAAIETVLGDASYSAAGFSGSAARCGRCPRWTEWSASSPATWPTRVRGSSSPATWPAKGARGGLAGGWRPRPASGSTNVCTRHAARVSPNGRVAGFVVGISPRSPGPLRSAARSRGRCSPTVRGSTSGRRGSQELTACSTAWPPACPGGRSGAGCTTATWTCRACLSFYGEDAELPDPVLALALDALNEHYGDELGEPLCTAGLCLYRDGCDSVAWHGDTLGRSATEDTIVAIVSLGFPRGLLLRPAGGGPALRHELGRGDLFVMGGSCQRTWRHSVPKTARHVGPRLSVQFRPRACADLSCPSRFRRARRSAGPQLSMPGSHRRDPLPDAGRSGGARRRRGSRRSPPST